jgi:exodeoxyribonuclease V alpha subunit
MFESRLPPLCGVLASPRECRAAERWQKALSGLSQPEGFLALAAELAGVPPGLEPAAREELTLLLVLLLVCEAQGSAYLPLEPPERLAGLLEPFGAETLDGPGLLALEPVRCLWEGEGAPLRLEGGRLYSGRIQAAETALAALARTRALAPPPSAPVPDEVLATPDTLTEEQRDAVAAAGGALTLVTGGPGTGKTSIVVAMLRALVRREPPVPPEGILLAAPTGKAAQRMGQAIRASLGRLAAQGPLAEADRALGDLEPRTLHRLLGWDPETGGFRHHRDNPVAARAVIVDEASMIGLELMAALFAALPADTALVLLGDADQLPSVEAGQAFRDLVLGLPGNLRRLRHSFRMDPRDPQGRQVLMAARAVNAGQPADFWKAEPAVPLRTRPEDLAGQGVEVLAPTPGNLEAFCAAWARDQVFTLAPAGGGDPEPLGPAAFAPLGWRGGDAPFGEADQARVRRILAHYDQARILCPVNLGADLKSVESLNARFHREAVAQAMARGGLERAVALAAGEPVLVTRNDYVRGIFNGDQGVVLLVERSGAVHREVFFPRGGGLVHFPLAAIQEDLDLCYAMTVHKAQGSEFRRIALVLPDRAGPMLTREILYTALTRARRAVTILGSPEALETAIGRPVTRWSGLEERLGDG